MPGIVPPLGLKGRMRRMITRKTEDTSRQRHLIAARAAGAGYAAAFMDFSTGLTAILQLVRPEDVLLVKASRSSKLERVVEGLRKAPAGFVPGTALAA